MSPRAIDGRFVALGTIAVLLAGWLILVGGAWAVRNREAITVEVVQSGLEHPWDLAFTDEGRLVVTERPGRLRVFASGEPDADLLATTEVPDVRAELESGLMGVAVLGDDVVVCASRDPGGEGGAPWTVDVLRGELHDDGTIGPLETLPIGPTIGGPRHQGCAVATDAEGMIWLSIGEANRGWPAQDASVLNGKVLRVTPNGLPADDGGPIVSMGHRNPQGIAVRSDGLVIEVEHGTDRDDEINVIEPGGNYGYPCFTGAATPGPIPTGCGSATDYLPPAWASGSPTLATSGAVFLTGTGWGAWEGDLVVSTLKEEDLRRFRVASDGEVTFEETLLDEEFGRLRGLTIGPDGALYVTTTNGHDDQILRVTRSWP
ncbi:MAG TPA: PQQ-dependent sugar dehydrogenase [Candidatus Limnocylindria bacterium]|nr:PQQ-dependent sugar dehydrogenase [Candidatus Limnocylindria bacterium]